MSKNAIISITLVVVVLFVGFLFLRDGTGNATNEIQITDGSNKDVPKDGTVTEEEKNDTTIVEETPKEDPIDPPVDPTPPAPAPEKSADITITYTNSGFSPSTITISKGDTVEFINKSSRNMWPASNLHPVHTIYPGKTDTDCLGSAFDACTRVSGGESWIFTFNYVGSWEYHDHINITKIGTVIVQ